MLKLIHPYYYILGNTIVQLSERLLWKKLLSPLIHSPRLVRGKRRLIGAASLS
jgi:hypothetical protein